MLAASLSYSHWQHGSIAAALVLSCAWSVTPLPAQAPEEVLSGMVRDSVGGPVANARVTLIGTTIATAVTSNDGRFSLPGPSGGVAELEVRRLGFAPWQGEVDIKSGRPLEIRLVPLAIRLESVLVRTEPREPFTSRLAGFEVRQRRGLGEFITRADLDKLNSANFLDVLRRVRGVRISTMGNSMWTRVRLRGSDCPPLLVVDGFPASAGEFDFGMLEPTSLEGVEIYHGLASVPAEFVTGRSLERCGVIAIWTRATRARQRHEDVPQQVAPAAAVDLDGLMAEGSVYTAASVDEPAVMQRGSRLPYYPESLYDAGIGGRVLVEFVVNIVGKVEPATVRVVTASEPEFAEAVRSAIVSAEFSSPRIGAARVRQLVQIPFVFQPRPQSQ